MRNFILKVLFTFYNYYNKGSTKDIAYLSAILALMLIVFLNLFGILIYSRIAEDFLSKSSNIPRWQQYGFILFFSIPIWMLIKRIFKEEDVLNVSLSKTNIVIWKVGIMLYFIFSVILLIVIIKTK